jgi:DNA repair protein RecN
MLLWLSIRNFVLIESLDIEFSPGFTVLTGETGAGKSILLDAIGLLLGDRFQSRQLRDAEKRTEIAAGFSFVSSSETQRWLADHDFLDDNDPDALVLRRTLDRDNKSRAWINGRVATLAQLDALGETLIELHGQHAHQSLTRLPMQRQWLDAYAHNAELLSTTVQAWRAWRAALDAFTLAQCSQKERDAEKALLTQKHEDLSALAPKADEWERLNARQQQLRNADALIQAIEEGQSLLHDSEDAILTNLFRYIQKLQSAATHAPDFNDIAAQLNNAAIDIEEAARALRDSGRHLDLDAESLTQVENRISALYDIARKYRVRPEELPELAQETERSLTQLEQSADINTLTRVVEENESQYQQCAQKLSKKRQQPAKKLNQTVTAAMNELAMSGGRFEVVITENAVTESHGTDHIEFYLSAHPGQALAPLAKVASGGELSRTALALLTVLAQTGSVPTLIFDEIDTGIGGATGHTIGQRLRELGRERQVLCVTHLPQVAACAHQHWRVQKEGDRHHVETHLVALNKDERIEEIARMLGGASITAKTRAHAKELLKEANNG